jgi:hypothetical protein
MTCGLIDHKLAVISSLLDYEKTRVPLDDGRDGDSRPLIPAEFGFELVHALLTDV